MFCDFTTNIILQEFAITKKTISKIRRIGHISKGWIENFIFYEPWKSVINIFSRKMHFWDKHKFQKKFYSKIYKNYKNIFSPAMYNWYIYFNSFVRYNNIILANKLLYYLYYYIFILLILLYYISKLYNQSSTFQKMHRLLCMYFFRHLTACPGKQNYITISNALKKIFTT